MTYTTDTAHCSAKTPDGGFCPLLDCHRYWLHSELIRRRNSGRYVPHNHIVYVEPCYQHGTCPNYVKHQ